MTKIANSLIDLIGHTPLLDITGRFEAPTRILLKIEGFNPGGSVKDRAAIAMIEAAEQDGRLRPGGLIIEPTSGNTGIGLAWIAAVKGYPIILTMPDSMSIERRQLLAAYGAHIVLTPASEGMTGAVRRAKELQAEHPGSFIPGQFDNPANPAAHERTTAEEIWSDTEGCIDIFVAGVGTGGTVSGTGRALKRHKASIEIVAVEPAASPLLAGGKAASHKIQGIGANFVPQNFDPAVVDHILTVTNDEAIAATRRLAQTEGLLAGISSGAALHAALTLAAYPKNAGKTIVALLPDTGERYLSTGIFNPT